MNYRISNKTKLEDITKQTNKLADKGIQYIDLQVSSPIDEGTQFYEMHTSMHIVKDIKLFCLSIMQFKMQCTNLVSICIL